MKHGTGQFDPERYRSYLVLLANDALRRLGRVQNKLDATDVVQDAMLLAHNAMHQFHGNTEAEFTAWLSVILKNQLIDVARHFNREKRGAEAEQTLHETIGGSSSRLGRIVPADQTSPSSRAFKDERLLMIAEAMSALPEEQRQAIELRHVSGYTVGEIADRMARSNASVSGLLRRGLAELHAKLQDQGLE